MPDVNKFGKYKIIEKIGSGGMGDIYLAVREGKIRYPAAIKILHDHLVSDPEYIELFKREVKILNLFRTINHPNIVKIFDVGYENGKYYIEMEYIPGYSLREIMEIIINSKENKLSSREPLIPIEHLLEIGIDICYAMESIHNIIIAHRDITPSNIIISCFGEVKIIDFGIAKLDKNTGSLMGTLAYMSPEQINRLPLDCRSDIYSLGMILFELLTGKRPSNLEDPQKILKSLRTPKILLKVIQKSVSLIRENRYQNASDFRYALEECRYFYMKQKKKLSGKVQLSNFLSSLYFKRDNFLKLSEELLEGFSHDISPIVYKEYQILPRICKLASSSLNF